MTSNLGHGQYSAPVTSDLGSTRLRVWYLSCIYALSVPYTIQHLNSYLPLSIDQGSRIKQAASDLESFLDHSWSLDQELLEAVKYPVVASDSEWQVTQEWRSIKVFSHNSLYINQIFLPSFSSLYYRINTQFSSQYYPFTGSGYTNGPTFVCTAPCRL
jgi:hypothetical protein